MSRYVFNCGLARIAEISSVESAVSAFRHDEPFLEARCISAICHQEWQFRSARAVPHAAGTAKTMLYEWFPKFGILPEMRRKCDAKYLRGGCDSVGFSIGQRMYAGGCLGS
jgi:hypothetical protein